MTTQDDTQDDTQATAQERGPGEVSETGGTVRPRRRRAASRPAGPPTGAQEPSAAPAAPGTGGDDTGPATGTAQTRPAVEEAPAAAAAPHTPTGQDAEQAEPTARRRPRRATKRASAPTADTAPTAETAAETSAAETPAAETPAAETPAAETPAAETPAAETPAAEPAPTRTRSRRATRKTAAPAADATSPADADPVPQAGPGPLQQEVAEPVAQTPAGQPGEAVEPNGVQEVAQELATPAPATEQHPGSEEEQEGPSTEPVAPDPGTLGEQGAEDPDAEDPDAEDPLAGLPPAARATAIFFQAPEPERAVRRSRRASSPAGPPLSVFAEPAAEDLSQPADRAAEDPDEIEDGEDETPRRRRRRGGRGRRSRTRDEVSSDGADEDARPADDREDDDTGEDDTREDDTREDDAREDEDEDAGTDGDEDVEEAAPRGTGSRRRRRGRGRAGSAENADADDAGVEDTDAADGGAEDADAGEDEDSGDPAGEGGSSRRRRRRRRRGGAEAGDEPSPDDPPNTVVRVREPRRSGSRTGDDEITSLKGSTRLEAKKMRRREGREAGRRRTILTEAEFLARRESVERVMVVRERGDLTQIGVLEDGLLVEHYVARQTQTSMVGNVYLGRVQNVLPSMEAAFVDVGKGRNAVLYAGEVNWDAAGLEGQPKRIEVALKSGDSVLVQVTKDPVGHKGARLTSQISLPGRYLVYVPRGSMTGISRKLPDTERARLKKVLKKVVPEGAGVIVRTAAEGISEEELAADVERLQKRWEEIQAKSSGSAPALLHGEPDLTVRVVRDVFNEDFSELIVSGDSARETVRSYVESVAPDLLPRVRVWEGDVDVFAAHRIDEQLAKALDRKVYLPSGGSLVIDRTEAMTVVDVNTGKFTGSGGNLEETVTRNNLEAAEEIVRQLRLRDVGGIIVIDFIDMVLESNRDLVLRRLTECLGRDRTKHQVAEVTSLGLVQMTRKRAGQSLLEAFSETCEACSGRGLILHDEPVDRRPSGSGGSSTGGSTGGSGGGSGSGSGGRRGRGGSTGGGAGAASERSAVAVVEAGTPGGESRPAPRPGPSPEV